MSDGNAILGHVFGAKDVSRNVAAHAASQTGLDAGLLKKMLPLVAAAAMGAMGKQTSGGGRGQSQVGGMLASFLDADGDGSVADDLLSMAKKFFWPGGRVHRRPIPRRGSSATLSLRGVQLDQGR